MAVYYMHFYISWLMIYLDGACNTEIPIFLSNQMALRFD